MRGKGRKQIKRNVETLTKFDEAEKLNTHVKVWKAIIGIKNRFFILDIKTKNM